ncbi:hypothetical protein D9611_002694 [Ephemerocybe angulata]|uniref:Uncharacterized protein n=1 Tax=Ephemerocybe angulata TaxID=980116 RepID=A0A8H5FDJ2_9AGAR|nr:hypothetical protein D9611_002694 [Tulosesus angulatus]
MSSDPMRVDPSTPTPQPQAGPSSSSSAPTPGALPAQAAQQVAAAAANPQNSDVASVIGQIMKQQFGEGYAIEKIAHILRQNMDHFAKQGKLSPAQIEQLKLFAEKHEKSQVRTQSTP